METQILTWLHDSAIGQATRGSQWLFAACETVHFIGLCTLLGALLIVDLRLIGLFRVGSMKATLNFTYVAMVGFGLNLISGFGAFCSNPANYWQNPYFRWKMVLILLAGLNVLWFEFVEKPKIKALADGERTDLQTRAVAALSLALWVVVIVLGRFLPVAASG